MPLGGGRTPQKAQEKLAENCMYETIKGFPEVHPGCASCSLTWVTFRQCKGKENGIVVWGWGGRKASTLLLQTSFSSETSPRNQKRKKKKALSQLLFLQLGSDQLPKCVPGASLSLNCLFYRSTDHIWKSLGRQGSPVASAPR